ncbi:hypothetical protein EV363DRAFT_1321781 [Boletus edulis]|nr:hypothetical protein EV363DRAFT_1321781 [Boletus edulis]
MASTSQPLSEAAYSPDTCMFCSQSLRITTSAADNRFRIRTPSGTRGTNYPDPVLGAAVRDTGTETEGKDVPTRVHNMRGVCRQNILDPSGRFIVDVRNEGGETRGFDFGVIIEEEEFLDSHPSQVHSRAFHDLVAEGDYVGAIDVIAEHDVDVNCTYGNDGLTALQKAMYSGDASGVEFLRSLGATV